MVYLVEQLCDAVERGDLQSAARLLDEGADPNARNYLGRTPLRFASEKGHVSVLQLLEERGGNIQLRDKVGHSLLHLAGTPEMARWLVGRGLDVNSPTGPTRILEGRTPLMLAASDGRIEVINALLELGAHLQARDPQDSSALTHALQNAQDATASALIEAGAYVGPVEAALIGDCDAVRNGLPARPELMTRLILAAASRGRIAVIDLLLDAGVSPNTRGARDQTPLCEALLYRQMETAEALLERGADPDLPGSVGKPPLMWAAMWREPRIIRLLLTRGANPDAIDRKSATSLVWATYDDNIEIARLLLEAGADPDVWEGWPLSIAAEHGQLEMLRLLYSYGAGREQKPEIIGLGQRARGPALRMLLENGADPNIADVYGRTSLMHAALEGDISDIHLLLDHGAEIDAQDPAGTTALMIAAMWRQFDAYHALLSRGADPLLQDNGGMTAGHWNRGDGRII
ncbi:MAG TPA: ankyrin repeat domain-containing protein [Armatimonadota bacterium]|nr:ankyrin repeat domain-containing protein [Armatimonadota bacterium]